MNNSNFDSLTASTRRMLRSALDTINDPKRGIGNLVEPQKVSYHLGWYAADWMTASYMYAYAEQTALALENVLRVSLEERGMVSDADWEIGLDAAAEQIRRRIASDCISVIFRGVEHSSNPMSALESGAKVDAAKKALDSLAGLSSYHFSGHEMIDDIFDGKARREEERAAARAKIVTTVKYFKRSAHGGLFYAAEAFNHLGEWVDMRPLSVTRKGDALTAVAAWVKEIQEAQGGQSIRVEAI